MLVTRFAIAVSAATLLAGMMLLLVGTNLGGEVVRPSCKSDNWAVGEGSAATGNEAATSMTNTKKIVFRVIFDITVAFSIALFTDPIGPRVSEASEASTDGVISI